MGDFWQADRTPTEMEDASPHRPGQPSPGPIGIKEWAHFARESISRPIRGISGRPPSAEFKRRLKAESSSLELCT